MSLASAPRATVVDASVAVRLLTGDAPWPDRWAEWARTDTMLLAPAHFGVEVANALLRGSTTARPQIPLRLARMAHSGVDLTDRGWHGLAEAAALAAQHRLSVYDALYLQLALDIDAPLATLDRALAAAAAAEGVEVID